MIPSCCLSGIHHREELRIHGVHTDLPWRNCCVQLSSCELSYNLHRLHIEIVILLLIGSKGSEVIIHKFVSRTDKDFWNKTKAFFQVLETYIPCPRGLQRRHLSVRYYGHRWIKTERPATLCIPIMYWTLNHSNKYWSEEWMIDTSSYA
jgi:hypothetical protein